MMWGFAQISDARGGKALIVLWTLTIAILLVTPVATWLSNREELLGNITFSLLVAAVLADVSNVVVGISRNPGVGVAKVAWVGLCIIALLLIIDITEPDRPDTIKDAGTVLSYLMLTLSFPVGFLVVLLLIGLGQIFGLGELGSYTSNLIAWVLFVVLGYVQWFMLFPYLIGRLRKI